MKYHIEKNTVQESWGFSAVSSKSYMRGYRDIYQNVGLFHKVMIRFCDSLVKMRIVKIGF